MMARKSEGPMDPRVLLYQPGSFGGAVFFCFDNNPRRVWTIRERLKAADGPGVRFPAGRKLKDGTRALVNAVMMLFRRSDAIGRFGDGKKGRMKRPLHPQS